MAQALRTTLLRSSPASGFVRRLSSPRTVTRIVPHAEANSTPRAARTSPSHLFIAMVSQGVPAEVAHGWSLALGSGLNPLANRLESLERQIATQHHAIILLVIIEVMMLWNWHH